MRILDRLFGKKNNKVEIDNGNKTDKPVVKTEINRQDIRDAMQGKNGKIVLMPGVLVDTITMREIPMNDSYRKLITIRGMATSIQCFISSRYGRMSSEYRSANLISLCIGEKNININKDNSLPLINDGDDVEAMCIPSYSKDVLDALVLKNYTKETLWCFNMRRAVLGF